MVVVTTGLSASRSFPLPAIAQPSEDFTPTATGLVWLDERQVLLQLTQGCGESLDQVLDVETGGWSDSPFHADYGQTDVAPLAGSLFAVFGSGEGCSSLGVSRADGTQLRESLDLGCVRDAEVVANLDGSALWLTSACDLSATGPFDGCDDSCELTTNGEDVCPTPTPRQRLYRWSPAGPVLLRDDLPPGARVDASGARFAWRREGALCVGDPAAQHQCFDGPAQPR